MGLKEVKEDIIEEAQKEADSIVEKAEQEKEEIINDAEKEAEKLSEEAEQEIEEEKQALEKRRLSNARMKAKEKKLEAKQKKIDEAFKDFRTRLENLDSSQKESFVESCVDSVGFEIGEIKASEGFQDAAESQGYSPGNLEDGEGVVIFSDDGEKSQDFTLQKIVDNYRQDHRKEAAEVLFQ